MVDDIKAAIVAAAERAATYAPPKIAYLGYCGAIDPAGVTRICQNLNGAILQKFDGIYLCLTSNGGYVGDGVYLFNHIRALPIPVTIHNAGTVASIATTLFVAAEKRYCSQNAMFMMHPIAVGSQAQMASAHLVDALESAKADEERTEAILRSRTKMPADILTARLRAVASCICAATAAASMGAIPTMTSTPSSTGNASRPDSRAPAPLAASCRPPVFDPHPIPSSDFTWVGATV
jgi:ATP-dependent Clp protease, protease subunit